MLLQNADDLVFGKPDTLHLSDPFGWARVRLELDQVEGATSAEIARRELWITGTRQLGHSGQKKLVFAPRAREDKTLLVCPMRPIHLFRTTPAMTWCNMRNRHETCGLRGLTEPYSAARETGRGAKISPASSRRSSRN